MLPRSFQAGPSKRPERRTETIGIGIAPARSEDLRTIMPASVRKHAYVTVITGSKKYTELSLESDVVTIGRIGGRQDGSSCISRGQSSRRLPSQFSLIQLRLVIGGKIPLNPDSLQPFPRVSNGVPHFSTAPTRLKKSFPQRKNRCIAKEASCDHRV